MEARNINTGPNHSPLLLPTICLENTTSKDPNECLRSAKSQSQHNLRVRDSKDRKVQPPYSRPWRMNWATVEIAVDSKNIFDDNVLV
jgi:hypothetical protein